MLWRITINYCLVWRCTRVLLFVVPSGFDGYFRALSRPAEAMTLPPPVGPPSPEQMAAMETALAEHGVTFVREG
jgi:hypothetical protein